VPRDVLHLPPIEVEFLPAAGRPAAEWGDCPQFLIKLPAETWFPGVIAHTTRSIRRPIARIPVQCITRLCAGGLPQASGKVALTTDQ
jgi:hypothetical protein